MHWFWRGTIAVAVGVVAGFAAYFGTSYLASYAVRSGWISTPISMPLTYLLIFGPPVLPFASACAASLIAFAWLSRRQVLPQNNETRCRKCGYILRGIPEPRCSECGERI